MLHVEDAARCATPPADWSLDRAHARQSMFSFMLLSSRVAVIERRRLPQTNDAELKMKNDKLDLGK